MILKRYNRLITIKGLLLSTMLGCSLFVSSPSLADAPKIPDGESVSEKSCDFFDQLKQLESSNRYNIVGGANNHYMGAYQMGSAALQTIGYQNASGAWTGKDGIFSKQDFLNNPAVQDKAVREHYDAQKKFVENILKKSGGIQAHVGSYIPGCSNGVTESGIMGGAHLVGHGAVAEYFKSGMTCGKAGTVGKNGHVLKYSTSDGNNVCIAERICKQSSCNPLKKDMSKNACDTVMNTIIDPLQCSNLPSNLRGFCNTYKPYLMTRQECESAEAFSKAAPKGPEENQCENLTFGAGMGSWSFALACSWAGSFVADQDGAENPNPNPGDIQDPECIEKLKSLDPTAIVVGRLNLSNAKQGLNCVIENAVSTRGNSVPLGNNLTMTCEMAVAMELWGQKMRSIGVTKYSGTSSVSCRYMITNKGTKFGTVSEHARGRAVDVRYAHVGGTQVDLNAVNNPLTPAGVVATQAKSFACSIFRAVLSPTWNEYKGSYGHFHVEWGNLKGRCL